MKFWKLASALTALLLASSAHAAIVTQGYLTTNDDGSSNIITDSLNNVEYLRFDVLADLTYAETIAVLDTQDGGGWTIASSAEAISFTAAFLGGSTSCTHNGIDAIVKTCGFVRPWSDGFLGANFDYLADLSWFLDDNGNADYVMIDMAGTVLINDWDLASSDNHAALSETPVSWLVVRPTVVPVPPAVFLFGSGLLGLIGLAKRKAS